MHVAVDAARLEGPRLLHDGEDEAEEDQVEEEDDEGVEQRPEDPVGVAQGEGAGGVVRGAEQQEVQRHGGVAHRAPRVALRAEGEGEGDGLAAEEGGEAEHEGGEVRARARDAAQQRAEARHGRQVVQRLGVDDERGEGGEGELGLRVHGDRAEVGEGAQGGLEVELDRPHAAELLVAADGGRDEEGDAGPLPPVPGRGEVAAAERAHGVEATQHVEHEQQQQQALGQQLERPGAPLVPQQMERSRVGGGLGGVRVGVGVGLGFGFGFGFGSALGFDTSRWAEASTPQP